MNVTQNIRRNMGTCELNIENKSLKDVMKNSIFLCRFFPFIGCVLFFRMRIFRCFFPLLSFYTDILCSV